MHEAIKMQIGSFALVYLLLLIVLWIMKRAQIDQTKLLVTASVKMTVQLVLAGLILTYIFQNPHPVWTVAYVCAMLAFTIHRIFARNPWLNKRFRRVVILAVSGAGLSILIYFVKVVVGTSIFHPQYVIPIAGMIMGNTMNSATLGLKSFHESLEGKGDQIHALQCAGASADRILLPFVRQALETAMLPTLNSMLGMGIVALPGMMTGQILAGTLPTTAILYQIAIMIAIATVVSLASFGILYFGYKTMFDEETQIIQLTEGY